MGGHEAASGRILPCEFSDFVIVIMVTPRQAFKADRAELKKPAPTKAGTGEGSGWQTRDRETLPSRTARMGRASGNSPKCERRIINEGSRTVVAQARR
jgi:hypothetical protein